MDRNQAVESLFNNFIELGRTAYNRNADHFTVGVPTQAQIGIMFSVSISGTQSIKALAQKLRTTSSAVTQVVNGLVKEGLLARTEDEEDRRRICVKLTPKGIKKMAEIHKLRLQLMRTAVEPLTDKELTDMQRMMGKVIDHLKTIWTKKQ